MRRFNQTFFEGYCKDSFDEFLSDSVIMLKQESKEYQQLLNKKYNIFKKCPKLFEIIENNEKVALSKEESKYIYEYELAIINIMTLEQREMFLRGMREAYYLFKKLNIIK